MTSLRELQREFMHAVLDGTPPAPGEEHLDAGGAVIADGIAPRHRLGIYRANANTNFSASIASSFPVVRRLVGAEYFEHCVRGFQRETPSRSGDLLPAGRHFADHLTALHRGGEYRYLGDVARLEWLVQEASLAGEHAALDVSRLAAAAPDDYERLEFRLHPSLRLFESVYPCLDIWRANMSEGEPEVIHLHGTAHEHIAIMRDGGELRFHVLSPGEYAFLGALRRDASFGVAVEAGETGAGTGERGKSGEPGEADESGEPGESSFDAAAALRRFVLAAAIVDFR